MCNQVMNGIDNINAVKNALIKSGKNIPLNIVTISPKGQIIS